MSIKILVLGSTGMLGYMVSEVLSREKVFTVCGTHILNRTDLFYFDVEEGLEKLGLIYRENGGYDYVINCIGITADKINLSLSSSLIKAIKLNSLFPHQLAEFALQKNIRVIHISTDGVFSGGAQSYDEDDPHDCTDAYGKTKSLGEVTSEKFLNIRCSVLGPSPFEKRGLFEWFRSRPEGSVVSGYTNHVWNGVTTFQFVELCREIIKNDQFDCLRKESSVFHFAPNHPVSKYELLIILRDVLDKNITINPVEHSSGAVKRILVTKYRGLKGIYGQDSSIENAIRQLIEFVK